MKPLCDAPCLRLADGGGCSGHRCLIDCARMGDRAARELVFSRLHALVYRQARILCGQQSDAEDLTQTALLRVFEKLAQLRDSPRLLSWTWRIVRNTHLMGARRSKFAPRVTLEYSDKTELQPGGQRPDPFEQLSVHELQRSVVEGIRALPSSLRAVFDQRVLEGRTTLETAAALRISTEAVRTRLVRARRALRMSIGLMDTCRVCLLPMPLSEPELDAAVQRAAAAHGFVVRVAEHRWVRSGMGGVFEIAHKGMYELAYEASRRGQGSLVSDPPFSFNPRFEVVQTQAGWRIHSPSWIPGVNVVGMDASLELIAALDGVVTLLARGSPQEALR